jgi:uncharacterized protein (DUF1697 family)/predicted DNA-binding protein (MmcQ/YjbR family)
MQPAVALARLRALLGKLPDVVETESWGHPNWKRGSRQFASFDVYGGRPSICFKAAPRVQASLATKKHFFLAPYAASRGWVCRTLDEPLSWAAVSALVLESYELLAPLKKAPSRRKGITSVAAKAHSGRAQEPTSKVRRGIQARGIHVALLRGINLAGHNRLSMKHLSGVFAAVGCLSIETYIQSGNVVFLAEESLAKRVPALVSERLSRELGIQVPVVTRSAAELRRAARDNPFLKPGADMQMLHVAFLAARPTAELVASLDPHRSPSDDFIVIGRDVFLRLPNGMARTKLTNAYLDSRLATTSTIRNWRTVLRLLEMTRALSGKR